MDLACHLSLGSLPCGYSQMETGAQVTSQASALKYLVLGTGGLDSWELEQLELLMHLGLSMVSPAQWLQLSRYMVAQGPKGLSPKNEPSRSYVLFSGLVSEIT